MKTSRLFAGVAIFAVVPFAAIAAERAISGLDAAAQPPKVIPPLLSGFNPDPTICRVGKDYYLATSSFELLPGIPIYHSTDLRNWTVVSHAWTKKLPCKNDDYGIWAPTLRHHGGMFYIVVTWRGGFDNVSENYLLKAKDPKGPWSDPVMVDDTGGIDPSLFFDDDGTAWYLANRAVEKGKGWNSQTYIWMQRIDLGTGRRFGDEHALTAGVGKKPKWVEGPHLYKIDGKYVLAIAQGGTSHGHGEMVLTSDRVTGPYLPLSEKPLLTAVDWGKESPYQSFGHADIVDTPDGRHFAVFLGRRFAVEAASDGGKRLYCPLGRETFMCPVAIGKGVKSIVFECGKCIAGSWTDSTKTRYSLMSRPDDANRYVKAQSQTDKIDYPQQEPHFFGGLRLATEETQDSKRSNPSSTNSR